jgi:hypothetical protein
MQEYSFSSLYHSHFINSAAFYFGVQSDEGVDDHYQCKCAVSCGSVENIIICLF